MRRGASRVGTGSVIHAVAALLSTTGHDRGAVGHHLDARWARARAGDGPRGLRRLLFRAEARPVAGRRVCDAIGTLVWPAPEPVMVRAACGVCRPRAEARPVATRRSVCMAIGTRDGPAPESAMVRAACCATRRHAGLVKPTPGKRAAET
ncbi:hypothetical protein Asi02nite_56460 [Asanoa siamensis]|uniref:Uncharacterized protein n=1 Tax=Asanoa siamensis TaxID=926357 RepID=A0ABQ4CXW4_9ACTN|nr:hypothetical protein Asi02nite_56460 [Asanoa siamensis]